MKLRTLLFILLLCASAAAEDSGPLPFEPWVKTARVGDFVVRKYTDGTTQRCEVKNIDDRYLIVEEKSELKGKETTGEKKFKRKESSGKTREIEMKSTGKDKQTINGTKVRTESFDG